MANTVDPDETLHSAVSHLGLHCLFRLSVQIHMVKPLIITLLLGSLAKHCQLNNHVVRKQKRLNRRKKTYMVTFLYNLYIFVLNTIFLGFF